MFLNFGWIREGRVAGMAQPPPDVWPVLVRNGVGAVLVLTERGPMGDPSASGVAVAHVPLVDFGTPSQEDLGRCVDFIDEQLAEGRGVVVHCAAGQGRTGTVLAAWLVRHGATADEAIAEVRARRPGSIETDGQVEALHRFGVEAGG